MELPRSEKDKLVGLLRASLDRITEMAMQPRPILAEGIAPSVPGDASGSEELERIDDLALLRFREYNGLFNEIWDALDGVVASYPKWQWNRTQNQVKFAWGAKREASMELRRVGLTAVIEVHTPILMHSYVALLPSLLVEEMGNMYKCYSGSGPMIARSTPPPQQGFSGSARLRAVEELVNHTVIFCGAVCQSMLIYT